MLDILKNKQILYLFLSGCAILYTGMGLFPILPLYAARFDASSSIIGFYFAIIYAANSLAPAVTGWLAARFSKRMVFIVGGAVGVPAVFLMGQAQNLVQVIVLTSVIWFSGGLVMSLVSILTGEHTDANSRGKAFSLMALVGPLGSLVGGASVGRLVATQGYPFMFAVLALVWSFVPLIGWLKLKEGLPVKAKTASARRPAARTGRSVRMGSAFARILAVTFLGSMAVNVSRLGSTLSMQASNYSTEAVSSVAMVGGLVAIPFTLTIGSLADRLGSKHFLFVSYLFMVSGALILMNASATWQYWLASILNMLAFSVSGAISQSLTSEVLPPEGLSAGLSWVNTTSAAANILCFAVGGVMFELLGLSVVFLIAALVALAAGTAIEGTIHTSTAADCREMGEACT